MKKADTILIINAGSSSVKFQVFKMSDNGKVLVKGLVERIGNADPHLVYERADGVKVDEIIDIKDHTGAMRVISDKLADPTCGVVASLSEIDAIGHRVLHGGKEISASVMITPHIKNVIRECFPLGPLHNPPNLAGIEACEASIPSAPNVGVFDTAFHQTMPDAYKYYAVPRKMYDDYGVRKYGFHGTSHKFVTRAAAEFLGKKEEETTIITCHLGNGSSCAAVKNGKVVDTSMGLTPLPGLVMGTRCGDIDAAVVMYLMRQGMSVDEVDNLLNKQSGLMGVSELPSGDMRDLITAKDNGNTKAQLAFDMFLARLIGTIGSYYFTLQGCDGIVFTGGIGENSIEAREAIMERLAFMGCRLDKDRNNSRGKACYISTDDSTLKAFVMPTNEELMIALDTERIVEESMDA